MFYIDLILSISKAIGVPGALLLAICTHESRLINTVAPEDHGSPSYGLCQIKENTAKGVGFTDKPEKLMVPTVNITYAAKYLKKQLERYEGNWCRATAAYNAGSYNPSNIPGKPRNLAYINKVILQLKAIPHLGSEDSKKLRYCDSRKTEFE